MTKKRERAFALSLAIVFFVTSVAFTGLVIWEANKGDQTTANNADIQKALEEAQAQNDQSNEQPKEGTLEGTKLANFTPVDKVESLQKIDTVAGTGEEVKPGAKVTAHYTGALAKDGTIFQSSHDGGQPIPFGLDQVIKGWTEGVPGMKVGGTRRLIIPAAQAYGAQSPSPNIPPNSDLVFDIEVVAVEQ